MDFGVSFDESLINGLKEPFPSIQMCPEFMSLSRRMQILIARKRLWLLLRGFDLIPQYITINLERLGFLSIFEEQPVFNFEFNSFEKEYIEQSEKDKAGKSKK